MSIWFLELHHYHSCFLDIIFEYYYFSRFTSPRGSDNSPSAPSVTAPRGLTTIRTPVTALRGASNGGRIVLTGKRRRQRPNGVEVSDENDSGFEDEEIDNEPPQFTEEDRRSSSISGGRRKLNRIPSGSDFASIRRKPANGASEAEDITGLRFTGRRRLRPSAPSGPSGPAEIAENDDDNVSAEDYEVTAPGAAVVNTEYEDIFPPPVLPNIQPKIQISTVG